MARAGDGTRPRGMARVDTSGASSAGDIFGLEGGQGVMLGTLCSATQNVRCFYPLETFVMVHFTRGCRLHCDDKSERGPESLFPRRYFLLF